MSMASTINAMTTSNSNKLYDLFIVLFVDNDSAVLQSVYTGDKKSLVINGEYVDRFEKYSMNGTVITGHSLDYKPVVELEVEDRTHYLERMRSHLGIKESDVISLKEMLVLLQRR